ncbi:MAG: hypothetical protein EON59_15075 [Alphaproteobacteria bacterium]|nr:MAG: hypothetical protein EON59_15075 [Alphaproteobacteria bacterium]
MAQFDVYRIRGNVLVIDCQSDLLSDLQTRFVVPLRPTDAVIVKRLTPSFTINGQALTMVTPLARAIDIRDIEAIGRAAREKAVSQFAWNRVFEDLCMVYGELTGEAAFVNPDTALPLH